MVLNGFDSVKAFSIGNYSRRRKLKWLFEFFVLLFLVLNQSSLFSLAGPVIRHFSRQLVLVFNSHIFVFLVFHAMLLVVYSLSHLTDNKSGSNWTAATAAAPGGDLLETLAPPRDDSVDEISVVREKNTPPSIPPTPPESLAAPIDEILVVREKTTAPPPVDGAVAEISVVGVNTPAISPVIEVSIDATTTAPASPIRHFNFVKESETRRYRRSESERFEEKRSRKLRRSKTEIHREDGGEAARLLNTVDEMDIDDFNRTVESFIAEQKLHIAGKICS